MAGAFGNPLSAGIALQVDVNKIFNDERKLRLAEKKLDMSQEAARAKQRKADEKELAGILSKITSDDSKIWWRYQDAAKHSYANTIRDVSNAWKAGDYNSAHTKLKEHNVKMTGLQQATKLKDDWITRAMKGDVYIDQEFLKALEDRNVDMTTLAQMGHGYGIFNDDSGTLAFSPLTQVMKVDDVMADVLKASSKTIRRDPKTGETLITGSMGSGINKQYQYMTQKGDREGAIESLINAYGTNLAAKQGEIQRAYGWDYLENLNISNPNDPAEINRVLDDELRKLAGASYDKQAYEEKLGSKPNQGRTTYDFGFGRTGIGDVQFGSVESSDVVSEYSTPEQKIDAVKNYYVGGISSLISESVKQQDQDAENYFKDNLPSSISDAMGKHNLYVDWSADFDPGLIKIVDAGNKVVGEVNLQSGDAAQQFFDVIRKNVGDDKLTERSQDYEGMQLPETTRETTLTPIGKTFTAEIAGAKEPKATWKLKAGDTVYMVGDATSQKVVLTNDLTLPEGKWQGATPYKDQAGKESIYYDVTFPVGYSEDKLARWFGGKNELSSFKEANKDALPVTMLIPENQSTLSTLESVLSTKEVRKALAKGDNETAKKLQSGNLSGLMREYMELPSTARTTSGASTTSTGANLPSFPINNP